MEPLLVMFHSISDLHKASVNSPEAAYILFMVSLAVSVEAYLLYALREAWLPPAQKTPILEAELAGYRERLGQFLRGTVAEVLDRWNAEAEEHQDMPTASVVQAYKALLWSNLGPGDYEAQAAGSLLASLAYVHNWHGFVLGKVGNAAASEIDPEQRLLRFLQVSLSVIQAPSLAAFVAYSFQNSPSPPAPIHSLASAEAPSLMPHRPMGWTRRTSGRALSSST